ncbi:MAG TPA: folylpolyglutamate synthase/dihydrofolate synthase family protein [Mucilaginibacter sp.]|jgi:folylpolyglutamate synthase/dihydrofolate synthase
MTYQETIDYLYTQLPMFTRVGALAFKANLDNTITLCNLLDNPQNKFKSIHIAGTNGKGSTSHMLAAILQTAGYKTGLYTSPHLKDFRERIRINGQMIDQQSVIDFVGHHQQDFEQIQPSFFEMTVGLAFNYFANEQVDIAVIETGLGGRLDSTNIITPLLSVVTNIGWDHMNILGDTLSLIAGEKAGIIKPRIPVIIGERQDEVAGVFINKAKEQNAPISFASDLYNVDVKSDNDNLVEVEITSSNQALTVQLDLTGSYQFKNIKTVLATVNQLRSQGFAITDNHIKTALRQVKTLTGLHGRWETLSTAPLIICDTGHNPDGIQEVLKNIANVKYKQLHFVIGMVNDKDGAKVLSMLPKDAVYYFCKPGIPRGLESETLQAKAAEFALHGNVYSSVKAALGAAQSAAQPDDLVFVGGSTFVVAEVV